MAMELTQMSYVGTVAGVGINRSWDSCDGRREASFDAECYRQRARLLR